MQCLCLYVSSWHCGDPSAIAQHRLHQTTGCGPDGIYGFGGQCKGLEERQVFGLWLAYSDRIKYLYNLQKLPQTTQNDALCDRRDTVTIHMAASLPGSVIILQWGWFDGTILTKHKPFLHSLF